MHRSETGAKAALKVEAKEGARVALKAEARAVLRVAPKAENSLRKKRISARRSKRPPRK